MKKMYVMTVLALWLVMSGCDKAPTRSEVEFLAKNLVDPDTSTIQEWAIFDIISKHILPAVIEVMKKRSADFLVRDARLG